MLSVANPFHGCSYAWEFLFFNRHLSEINDCLEDKKENY